MYDNIDKLLNYEISKRYNLLKHKKIASAKNINSLPAFNTIR